MDNINTSKATNGKDASKQGTSGRNGQEDGQSSYAPRTELPTLESYPLAQTLQGHDDAIPSIRFSPDGSRIASASADGSARIWDFESGAAINVLRSAKSGTSTGVNDLVWGRNGTYIATACEDQAIRIWDPRSGMLVRILRGHTHHVTAVAVSASDDILASSSFDETIRLWDMHTGRCIGVIPAHSDPIISIAFNDQVNQPLLVSSSTDGICRTWAAHTRECLRTIIPDRVNNTPVTSCRFSINEKYILTGSLNSKLHLWDLEKLPNAGGKLKTYTGHVNTKYAIQSTISSIDPAGKNYVITGSEDHHVFLYELQGKEVAGLLRGRADGAEGDGHCDVVQGIDTHTHAPIIASSGGAGDCTVKIWRYSS